MPTLAHPVGRVRLTGLVEGVSYLLLLGIAMPLKYFAGMPQAVSIVGMAHGVLFILLALVTAIAWIQEDLPFGDSVRVMIASLLPFGPFIIDKRLALRETGD